VFVWDTEKTQESMVLKGHVGIVNRVCYSSDGTRLASAGTDGTVRLWGAAAGMEALALTGHEGIVETVRFSPDGRRLASVRHDGTMRIWDATPIGQSPTRVATQER
jgi:WD40 repeat protein